MFKYRPYPKSKQLKSPGKKERRLEVYKGRTIPTKRQRGKVSKKEYNRAIEAFGNWCVICGNPLIEMHHVVFRSQGGRGGFRNLIPLCNEHHREAHRNWGFAETLRQERKAMFGKYFYMDKWDLFKLGLIHNTTDKAFEEFFERGNGNGS
jgi:hypothetical protein